MILNKTLGHWYDYSNYIDDIAYQLYVNSQIILCNEISIMNMFVPQKHMMDEYYYFNTYSSYYNNANIFIRRQKIEKLCLK